MSLYFVSVGNKLFSTRIKTSSASKTHLIALTRLDNAMRLRNHIIEAQDPIEGVCFEEHIKIARMNYSSHEFNNMLKVNNFSLVLANDFTIDSITNAYEFHGSVYDFDFPIDIHVVRHLDKLYNKKSTRE